MSSKPVGSKCCCSVRLARDGSSAITYKILFSKLNETRGREQRETRASAENEGHLIDIGNCTNFNKEDESEGEQGCSSGEHVDAVAQEGPHEPGPSVRKKTDSKKWCTRAPSVHQKNSPLVLRDSGRVCGTNLIDERAVESAQLLLHFFQNLTKSLFLGH